MMKAAIFDSTPQALATAFLIISNPPQGDTALRRALIGILRAIQRPTDEQFEWLQQLQGVRTSDDPPKAANFDGLTGDEIRAQCAMIVKAPFVYLPAPEQAAVVGSYTHDPQEKVQAIQALSAYIKPHADPSTRLLYNYCIVRCLPKHGRDTRKSREVLELTGVPDRVARACLRETRRKVQELRKRGENRLEIIFIEQGVVNAA